MLLALALILMSTVVGTSAAAGETTPPAAPDATAEEGAVEEVAEGESVTESDDAAADDAPAQSAQSDDPDVDTASEDAPAVNPSGPVDEEPGVASSTPAANAINEDVVIAATAWQPPLLGTVTLDDEGNVQPGAGYTVDPGGNSVLFEYELNLAGEPGVCVTHTNIAALDLAAGEGPMASADVEVCQDSSTVPPAKPKPAKALASTGVSTGPALAWALGLIGAGVVVLAAGKLRRR